MLLFYPDLQNMRHTMNCTKIWSSDKQEEDPCEIDNRAGSCFTKQPYENQKYEMLRSIT